MVLQSTAPNLRFYESDQVLPAGRYRWLLDGDVFRLQYNTAVAGDFSAVSTPLYYNPSVTTLVLGEATDQVRTLAAAHQFADGTAALPSLTFAVDLDTGFYRSAANTIGFGTGGVSRATLDSTALALSVLLRAPDGTAAAPSLTFGADTDTGAYRIGANSLGLSTGGTLRLTLDTAALTSTLPFVGPLASAAAPAVTFTGDLDTGLFSPGANRVALATAGLQRFEVDATGYGSMNINGLGAGRIPALQMYRLNADLAGANVTTAQSLLGVGVTLVASTIYAFELQFALEKSAGTNVHAIAFLFGGTATFNNLYYDALGNGDSTALPMIDDANIRYGGTNSTAGLTLRNNISAAVTSGVFRVKGTLSVNAGGTLIPQYQLSAAPGGAYSTIAGAYMSIWPVAASGANVNIGTWA
jgi:hypothetical protein